MPCACRVPVPEYPSNAEWGPILWTILHGLAEHAGQGLSFSSASEEFRAWQRFLKAIGDVLPCDQCRTHYQGYLQANPLTQIPPELLKSKLKTWFWELHSEIRNEYGKSVLPYEELEATYKNVNFQDLFWRLEPILKRAIDQKGMGLFKWTTWTKEFKLLKAILGL
jgi:hypothetical protein